jgi:DNA transformation protein
MSDMRLIDLPNIGKTAVERLSRVGIDSVDELYQLGSQEAWLKLLAEEHDTCLNTLYALEGAVQGIRWHLLPEEKKLELKHFFNAVKKG